MTHAQSIALRPRMLWLVPALVLGVLAYANTWTAPFVLDDLPSIVENKAIHPPVNPGQIWQFWPTRFITYLTLALNAQRSGISPTSFHLTNLIIHLSATAAAGWLALLTASSLRMRGSSAAMHPRLLAGLTALLFVTHPVQPEAVTYITQRATSLATFSYLLSLCLFARGGLAQAGVLQSRFSSVVHTIAAGVVALIALYTKEMTITLPIMFLLYASAFFRADGRSSWRRALPLLPLLGVIPLTMLGTGSVNVAHMHRVGESESHAYLPYVLTQLPALVRYVRLLAFPVGLNFDHDLQICTTIWNASALFGLFLLAMMLIGIVRGFRSQLLPAFGVLWILIALVPESLIVPIRDVMAEHRLYLPMFGFALAIASTVVSLHHRRHSVLPILAAAVLGLAYTGLTYARNGIWSDPVRLWSDCIRKSPLKARPYVARGVAYAQARRYPEALADLQRAQELSSGDPAIDDNIGTVLCNLQRPGEAIPYYTQAIAKFPEYAMAYFNRGNAQLMLGRTQDAYHDFERVIALDPTYAMAYLNRGNLRAYQGDLPGAISDFTEALRLEPRLYIAYCNRARAHHLKGERDAALADCARAIATAPGRPEAARLRAKILAP